MSDRQTVLEDFLGTKCSGCSGPKKARMSHCRNCYYELPREMQLALYQRFGHGYEQAFEESTLFLTEQRAKEKS